MLDERKFEVHVISFQGCESLNNDNSIELGTLLTRSLIKAIPTFMLPVFFSKLF
jgi:hypothetical protein